MTRYTKRTDGEGFTVPCGEVYRIACCDCGLVHDFVFVSEDGRPIGVAARRNGRATGQRRRKAQREKLDRRGGAQWIRDRINRAKEGK